MKTERLTLITVARRIANDNLIAPPLHAGIAQEGEMLYWLQQIEVASLTVAAIPMATTLSRPP